MLVFNIFSLIHHSMKAPTLLPSLLASTGLLAILAMLSACGDSNSTSLKNNSLVYCTEGSPTTFNPQQATTSITFDASARVMFDRLVEYDEDLQSLQPGLAESWQVSDDGLHYIFKLRQNIPFHQTEYWTPSRDFAAEDVIFSFQRQLDIHHPYHKVGLGKYPMINASGLNHLIRDMIKIDDHTVEFILSRPNLKFPSLLAMEFASIQSAEYATSLYDNRERFDHYPIGTGPFIFQRYETDTYIRYKTNQAYWRGPAKIKTLVFAISAEASTRLGRLITKECDVMSQPLPSQIKIIKNSPSLKLESQPGLNVAYWAFNTRRAPFDDVRVRRALSYAISRETIIKVVYENAAHIANGPLPPRMLGAIITQPTIKQNLQLSRQLLHEAQWDKNFVVDIWAMPVQRPYNPNARRMAELIQNDLAKVQVKSRIISYEWGQFLNRLRMGQHQTVLLGWSADTNDPDDFLTPLLSCNGAKTGTNRAFWCDEQFDQNLRLARETTAEKRLNALAKAQQIFKQQLPWLPIAHSQQFLAYRNNLVGIKLSATGGINFRKVYRVLPLSKQENKIDPLKKLTTDGAKQ